MKLICDQLSFGYQNHESYEYSGLFESGHTYAVMGESGSGKSTFLDLISGFVEASSGRLTWNGQDLTSRTADLRPMSLLLQNHNLFEHMTALQNIEIIMPRRSRLRSRNSTYELAASLGLQPELLQRKPSKLSGGQQQRVALCRNLLLERPIMLLDEPFSGLDILSRDLAYERLRRWMRADRMILLVTHDRADAEALGAEVVAMSQLCQYQAASN